MNAKSTCGDCNKILLLHGIWMTGFEMSQLRFRLSGHGFKIERFTYPSVTQTPVENAERLHQFINRKKYDCVHFVAHSLGGLILLNLFDRYPEQPPGRVVLLGSPVQGSEVARRLASSPWTKALIGRAGERGLVDGAPPWRGGRDLGVIAGTSGMGIGRLLGGLSGESDGTVMVSETRIGSEIASRTHSAGHMGMLLSSRVADDVAGFLKDGHFPEKGQ